MISFSYKLCAGKTVRVFRIGNDCNLKSSYDCALRSQDLSRQLQAADIIVGLAIDKHDHVNLRTEPETVQINFQHMCRLF